MNLRTLTSLLFSLFIVACGGTQKTESDLKTVPLEEYKALETISSLLTNRGYLPKTEVKIELINKTVLNCDFVIDGARFAVEYLTEQERGEAGDIPPRAAGSKLHVVPARLLPTNEDKEGQPVYVFLMHDDEYTYQPDPTPDNRSDVTFLEVKTRLEKDLSDFLTWHETTQSKEK